MKSFLRSSLAAIAVILFLNAFAVTETKAQGVLNEILKRMEAHRNSLKSLQTNVTMEKYNPQIDTRDITEGTAVYLPAKGQDALVRIDWTKPLKETLSVVNKKYVIYREHIKQAIVGNADKAKGNGKANNLFAFMSMSKDELKANYTVKYLGQEKVSGGTDTWHLEMTPKNASSYKSAEMWVDTNGMPIQIKITETNKDTTTVLLTNFKKNTSIKASVFKVNLPKGTKIIDG